MKKTILKFAAFLVVSAVSFSSCSETEDFDYAGEDNYITKLSVTADDVTYYAAIANDEVVLTVPANISLLGAAVDYTISEKATISPDPTEKEDWGVEDLFVVTSYSELRRSYTYRVVREDLSATGNVILNTQSELEAFAAQGNSTIDGNLSIGTATSEDDPITSLASLSSIKSIAYNLTIESGYMGVDLDGLHNLEVAGNININDADLLESVYLPSLKSVGTSLNFTADNLVSIDIDQLTYIGGAFTMKSNLIDHSSFENLAYVGGAMTFNGGSASAANSPMERIQFPSLTTVDGAMTLGYWSKVYVFEMPKLEKVGGVMTFQTWASIEEVELPLLTSAGGVAFNTVTSSLSASLPELKTLDGVLTLNSAGITSISTPKLESVGGVFYIYAACTKLTSFDFSSLEHVYQLNIRSTVMTGLKDYFPALKTVDDFLYLYSCTAFDGDLDVSGMSIGTLYIFGSSFTNMTAIKGDDHFEGKLTIYAPLATVTEFPNIEFKSIRSLAITSGTSTTYFSGVIDLKNVEVVTEDLTFTSCTYATGINCEKLTHAGSIALTACNNVTSISFPALEEVTGFDTTAGNFTYSVSSSIQELNLPNLVSVDGNFSMTLVNSTAPITKIGFEKIKTIGGTLTMSGHSTSIANPYFNDLSTFSTLESVGGVSITMFSSLADFSGLSGIFSAFDGSWTVSGCSYNPSLQNMLDEEYVTVQ